MKKTFTFFTAALLLVLGLSSVFAVVYIGPPNVGANLDIHTTIGYGLPGVIQCGEAETTFGPGGEVFEREGNYLFEGESIRAFALAYHGSGVDDIQDVFIQHDENPEANCILQDFSEDEILNACDFGSDDFELNNEFMDYYLCEFTTLGADRHYGENRVKIIVRDSEDNDASKKIGTWFFNPIIGLGMEGDVNFYSAAPGTTVYSDSILISNEGQSEVPLDMFISGTDFYDSSDATATCPDSNILELSNFNYLATNGAYSTWDDPRSDAEGYVSIGYGIGFNDPNPFYGNNEMIQAGNSGEHYLANLITPGEEIVTTFRLDVPQFCKGRFDTGSIYFWGEAA